ncbi:MAG: YraN family protein [Bdellovibrionales bacterium]|nr:YraN family protein [Bdellovibrionales bacterium]
MVASKSTSLGLHSEARVERAFELRGYRTLERRWRTPFAELDLVFAAPDGELLIVEVKSSDWPEGMLAGLSRRQRVRLLRAREWLAEREGREVRLWLITFEAGARLRVMSIF